MNVLIGHAQPEPPSVNGALANRAVEVLTATGHEVELSDLYAMNFKAVVDWHDFEQQREAPAYLRVDREQTFSQEHDLLPGDIKTEPAKIARADRVILQYPMWWLGMPAILKGWADRVFTRGFAYRPGRQYSTGILRRQLGLVSV